MERVVRPARIPAYSDGVGNRPADAAQQQAAISEALWRVLRERGLAGLTLRAVAAEAGCTTGLVTSRFPSKRDLVIHARTMLHERAIANMRAAQESSLEPTDALRRALRGSLLGEGFDGRVWLGFLGAAVTDDAVREVQVASNRAYVDHVALLVQRARPEKSTASAEESATRLVVLMAGLAALSTADPEFYSLDRLHGILDDALDAALT